MVTDADADAALYEGACREAREEERRYREDVLPHIVEEVLAELNGSEVMSQLLPPGCRFVYSPA